MNKIAKQSTLLPAIIACALTAASAFDAGANEPGRGSDKDIKSAQGAALTNAQAYKNARADSQSVTNAQAQREAAGLAKQPGRGSPAGIKSARGAAVQNIRKEAAQRATSYAKGSEGPTFKNETKSADHNPGGMMSHFPASQ